MFDFLNLVSDRNTIQTGIEFQLKRPRPSSVFSSPEEQVAKEPFKLNREFSFSSVEDQLGTAARLEARRSEDEADFKSSLTPMQFTSSRSLGHLYKPLATYDNGAEILRTLNHSRRLSAFLITQLQPLKGIRR